MSAADYDTIIKIKGTQEELVDMVQVIQTYLSEDKGIYFESAAIGTDESMDADTMISLDQMSEEKLKEMIEVSGGTLYVNADGPYGEFGLLEDDIGIFEDIIAAAPEAYLYGEISGSDAGGSQNEKAEMQDGLLHLWFGGDEYDDFDDFDDFDDEDDEDGDDSGDDEDSEWVTESVYDPKSKTYVD